MKYRWCARAMVRLLGLLVSSVLTGPVMANVVRPAAKPARFERMHLGGFEVTALRDGGASVSAFLVDTGSKVVLVNAGQGASSASADYGDLAASLVAAGYRPAQVSDVLLTQVDVAHAGGISHWNAGALDQRVFPNAVIHVDAVQGSVEVTNGIWSVPLPADAGAGAATGYMIVSGAGTMFIWPGSAGLFKASMSGAPPTGFILHLFAALAEQRTFLAGPSLPWPSIGLLRKNGRDFRWDPLPFPKRPVGER